MGIILKTKKEALGDYMDLSFLLSNSCRSMHEIQKIHKDPSLSTKEYQIFIIYICIKA